MTMATAQILGRLGRDPELRNTKSGKAVASFSLGVQDGTRDNPHTTWFRCIAWDRQAEAIAKHFRKGDAALVTGNLISRSWVNTEGQTIETLELQVRAWSFSGGKKETEPRPEPTYKTPEANEDVPF